ncbi:transposase [Virgibacillus proomii]|uniref:transposase n=1 Tax=Virgibacillus proomii TaxID=84407 RepID=UPI0035A0296A
MCPNGNKLTFRYLSNERIKLVLHEHFKVYECEDCLGCPLRSQCTKAKEGHHRKYTIDYCFPLQPYTPT